MAVMPLDRLSGILLIAILLTVGWLENANGQPNYFRHYQVESGLSNNTVFCSVIDRNGFIWMGTKDGLNVFNGYDFKVYNSSASSGALKDSYIRSLYLDSSGSSDLFYLGTRIGVFTFDPLEEKFTYILKTGREVVDVLLDDNELLWAVAGKQLYCLNMQTGQPVQLPEAAAEPTSVCQTKDGHIWLATANGLLQRITRVNDDFQVVSYQVFSEEADKTHKWIERIRPAENGNIFIGSANYGALLFNPSDQKTTSLLSSKEDGSSIYARDFKEVNDSTLWIATESGIYIYNLHTDTYRNVKQQTGDPYSLSDNAVYSLTMDNEGGVWAGTYSGGLNYSPFAYNPFEKYYSGQGNFHALSGNVVREICQDEDGALWVGTEDGGLNKIPAAGTKTRHFHATGNPGDISYSNIHALLSFHDTLLVGTFEHGLDLMNSKTGKVMRHYPAKGSLSKEDSLLKSSFIITACRTDNGAIYLGTRLGLYRFFPRGNNEGLHFQPVLPALANSFIHTLMVDHAGRLWIGTMGSGLFCYSPGAQTVRDFNQPIDSNSTLSNKWITTIFEDHDSNIWVGTEGAGVFVQKRKDKKHFYRYTLQDGLPSNTVYKILEDNNGRLWMSTSKGLLCWHIRSGVKEVFTTANGLLSDQFNYNSGFKDSSGNLYFGSVKGLIRFNPGHFTRSFFKAPLFITSVEAAGETVSTWNSLLSEQSEASLNQDKMPQYLDIPHPKASIAIEFAALSYTAPEMIQYRYKLDGLDQEWTHLSSNRKVYFTNLSPGRYTFRVRSTNVSGLWNPRETKLYINVMPTFWESRLAICLYGLVGLGISLFLFRSYHDRIKEKNKRLVEHMTHEKEKELYEAKIDFFTHVTHEIKTPLTLIKAPLERINRNIDHYPVIAKYISMISRNAARLVGLSEQLLDFRKTDGAVYQLHKEQVDIRHLLEELSIDFKALARSKNVEFIFRMPDEPVYLEADKDALTKILTNLLDNTAKYGVAIMEAVLSVETNLQTGQPFIQFITINDGPVISDNESKHLFEPFYRTENAKSHSGAGLGLSLCRSLVALHQGELRVDRETAFLTKFILTLPVTPAGKHMFNKHKNQ